MLSSHKSMDISGVVYEVRVSNVADVSSLVSFALTTLQFPEMDWMIQDKTRNSRA